MRRTLLIAGAGLAVLAAASLVVILAVEPSPSTPRSEPPPVAPEVVAAAAAARETAVKEAAAKQAAAEEAAREAAAREAAAAKQAAAEAAAREAARQAQEAAAREAAAREAAAREAAAREAAAKEGAKEADGADGGAAPGAGPAAVAARADAGGEPGQATARSPTSHASGSSRPRGTASISARLEDLKPRLAQCYETARPAAGATSAERTVPPVFLIELEGAGDQYRVVDAGVDSRGSAEDAVLACMQSVLLGATLSAPGAEHADRVALRFSP